MYKNINSVYNSSITIVDSGGIHQVIDEREFKKQIIGNTAKEFENWVKKYDDSQVPIMKAKGYQCIHSMNRTVAFTFGEYTFRRRRWKRGKEWVTPVDEHLGLEKNTRFSKEFMFQVARLASMMSYDKVVEVIDLTYHIKLTKPVVVKAVKICSDLLEERREYHSFNVGSIEKKKIDVIYIEGDGVMVKSSKDEIPNRYIDLAHFIVHTGVKRKGIKQYELQNKKEFISMSNHYAREQVIDYIYNHFECDKHTLMISNSDGGHGYSPYVFREIAKSLNIINHEHFWDAYHLNAKLKNAFKTYPNELRQLAFRAVKEHDKNLLKTVFDTTSSLIESDEELKKFEIFKKYLLNNFQYTKPAVLRGLSHSGIGIMESQHRKITYRMKKGGRYWSVRGAETMSQMLIMSNEDELRELFFGQWREDYQKLKVEGMSGGEVRFLESKNGKSKLPKVKLHWKKYKY